ncbi:MAG TPA: hypothetical protein VJ746_18895 [Nitrospira sp.]|nr:hypothetical protein [Nitrospira sp.]
MKPIRTIACQLAAAASLSFLAASPHPGSAAEPLSDSQVQRLMETAGQAPDSPDHDYAGNSLESMLRQAKELNLSQEQVDKIKTISEQYARTRRDRETAYKQSELDALKLIHDSRSSLTSVESAVQKADQEHSKLRMAGIKALREARDVLRPEQYGNWRQNHAARQLARSNTPQEAGEGDGSRIAPH